MLARFKGGNKSTDIEVVEAEVKTEEKSEPTLSPDKVEVSIDGHGFIQIDAGTLGLVRRFHAPTRTVLKPGLRWVLPGIHSVVVVSMKLRRLNPPPVRLFTTDSLVWLDITVFYQIVDPFMAAYGLEGLVSDAIITILRGIQEEVVRTFDTTTLVSSPTGILQLKDAIMSKNDEILSITGATLRDVHIEGVRPLEEVATAFAAILAESKLAEALGRQTDGMVRAIESVPEELRSVFLELARLHVIERSSASGNTVVTDIRSPGATIALPSNRRSYGQE